MKVHVYMCILLVNESLVVGERGAHLTKHSFSAYDNYCGDE